MWLACGSGNYLTAAVDAASDKLPDAALIEKWFGCFPYGPKFTVTVLEQVCVPASHTLYMKLA